MEPNHVRSCSCPAGGPRRSLQPVAAYLLEPIPLARRQLRRAERGGRAGAVLQRVRRAHRFAGADGQHGADDHSSDDPALAVVHAWAYAHCHNIDDIELVELRIWKFYVHSEPLCHSVSLGDTIGIAIGGRPRVHHIERNGFFVHSAVAHSFADTDALRNGDTAGDTHTLVVRPVYATHARRYLYKYARGVGVPAVLRAVPFHAEHDPRFRICERRHREHDDDLPVAFLPVRRAVRQ